MISKILVLFFEFKANRMRPAIVKYLYNEKAYWEQLLDKFNNEDKVTRDLFRNKEEILQNVRDIEDELAFENTYQLLKLKYQGNKKVLAAIASDYYTFWGCLNYFRMTHGSDALDPAYTNEALKVGNTKVQVYNRFREFLGE